MGGADASGGTSAGGRVGSGGGGGATIAFGGANSGSTSSCSSTATRLTAVLPVLELLVDTSGSMAKAAPNSTLTKYAVTRDALAQTITELDDGGGVGLIFYPNVRTLASCINKQEAVPIAIMDAPLRQALLAALQAQTVYGNTPTHDALQYAYERLQATTVPGDKAVVLITDGEPTYSLGCIGNGIDIVDSAPLITEAENASTRGIRTFVIGSPGSEGARVALSQMATHGGTALPGCTDQGPNYCHFDMTTAVDLSAALQAALTTITNSARGCRYFVPAPPGGLDRSKVNVSLTTNSGNSVLVPQDTSSPCSSGWQFSASADEIVLCPSVCDMVKANPGIQVDLLFGCKTSTL
jgi:hypothetical protein